MDVLFLANIPSPYRVDFFNELGKLCNLTVTFEGRNATDRNKKWKADCNENFNAVFLKGKRVRSDAFLCPEIIKYIKQKWDYIILGGYSTPTDMLAIEYLRLHNIPFFIEADGGLIGNDSRLRYKIKRHFISAASGWLSSGKATTEYLVHYGAKKEKCYIYPFTSLKDSDIESGYNFKNSTAKSNAKAALGMQEPKVILSVGQLIPRKGFDILLKAAAHLTEDVGIYIVGGNATEELIKLKNELKLHNVHFIDFKTKDELADYYAAADIFVLPTREDIWGLVINEAMMYGLPIITTNKCVAGLELIENGENGFVVPSEDIDALSGAITNILSDDRKSSEMSENNFNKIRNYSITEMAQAHIRVFEILGEHK